VSIWRFSRAPGVLFAFTGLLLAVACDDAASCPAHPCDPTSDGVAFDLLDWCEASGGCLRDGVEVPICSDVDASPAPSCALGPVDASESLTFPVGRLWSTLGARHDLVVTYAACDAVSDPPVFTDVEILFDGKSASCQTTNPCDPTGTPTVVTCTEIPTTVQSITFSFVYDGAQGRTHLQVEMQDTMCSYFCS